MGKLGKIIGYIGAGAGALGAAILAVKTAREDGAEFDCTLEEINQGATPAPAAQPETPAMASVEAQPTATGTETQG